MEGRIDGQMDRRTDGWTEGQMDRRANGQKGIWTERRKMNGLTNVEEYD
jgi:hypothetical protein